MLHNAYILHHWRGKRERHCIHRRKSAIGVARLVDLRNIMRWKYSGEPSCTRFCFVNASLMRLRLSLVPWSARCVDWDPLSSNVFLCCVPRPGCRALRGIDWLPSSRDAKFKVVPVLNTIVWVWRIVSIASIYHALRMFNVMRDIIVTVKL